jgi:molybdenum cofactor guanylyltransferase
LVAHVIERLRTQVTSICISANRHLEEYQRYGWPVMADSLEGFLGPLAGIHSALLACRTDWLLIVPVDCPFLPEDLATRLSQAVISAQRPLAVVHDGKGLQPTFCLLHQSLTESLQHYLQQGGRKTGEWLRQQEPALADYSDKPDAFININTPEDLEQAEQRLQHAG